MGVQSEHTSGQCKCRNSEVIVTSVRGFTTSSSHFAEKSDYIEFVDDKTQFRLTDNTPRLFSALQKLVWSFTAKLHLQDQPVRDAAASFHLAST